MTDEPTPPMFTDWLDHHDVVDNLREACAAAAHAIDLALNQFNIAGGTAAVQTTARAWAIAEVDRLLTVSAFAEIESGLLLDDDDID